MCMKTCSASNLIPVTDASFLIEFTSNDNYAEFLNQILQVKFPMKLFPGRRITSWIDVSVAQFS